MADCIFCKIAAGQIPSAKVYENERVFGFLDINPTAEGHCLVVPKQHFENVFDIDGAVLQDIALAGKELAERLRQVLAAPAVNFIHSSGRQAGQEVMHFHLHVIARFENDGIDFRQPVHQKQTFEQLQKLAKKITTR